ncbi:MAG: BrnA antitoxin family protein [Steroidobacteraceae bacterium]
MTRRLAAAVSAETPMESQSPVAASEAAVVEIVQNIARRELPAGSKKAAISLRLDADVLDWFRAQGAGYQTRINAVLRAYKEASH